MVARLSVWNLVERRFLKAGSHYRQASVETLAKAVFH